MEIIQPARSCDRGKLKDIWKTVFGDLDAFIDLFFQHYGADTALVTTDEGEVTAAGYLLPAGNLVFPGSTRIPCAMIYSVAVLPPYRGRGLGTALTRALIDAGHTAGYPAVILRPASDRLFDYYSKQSDMREWFFALERVYSAPAPGPGRLTRLTVAEYARLRSGLLSDIAHIEPDERALSFQNAICGLSGGGLFAIAAPGGDACAVIERGETVDIKELLAPGCAEYAISTIATAFGADRYTARLPARDADGDTAVRFGMLAAERMHSYPSADYPGAWLGFAFD